MLVSLPIKISLVVRRVTGIVETGGIKYLTNEKRLNDRVDLTKPSELKKILTEHGLHLSKRFGQNFLVDRRHLMRVVETAEVSATNRIFEIGPGIGTLTVELAQRAASVLSVELDRSIIPALTAVTADFPNVTLLENDALRLDLPALLQEHWQGERGKVVANIPYNITSPLLIRLLENKTYFESITLMVQKEVADRMRARPDTDMYGSLSVFVQYHAEVTAPFVVPKGAFFPPPKVDSAIVHLVPRAAPPVEGDEAAFFAVSRSAFGQRRKTLLNALTNSETIPFSREQVQAALSTAGVDGQRRGETLTLKEIASIARALFAPT
jgi:16S rRNA (adenine1518-N6/adenine1519-N6)-dimethyltransferase